MQCPFCKAFIHDDASKCMYCGSQIPAKDIVSRALRFTWQLSSFLFLLFIMLLLFKCSF